MTPPEKAAPSERERFERVAWMLDYFVETVRNYHSRELEAYPYIPEIEECAEFIRRAALAAQAPVTSLERITRALNGFDIDDYDKRAEHFVASHLDGLAVGPLNRNGVKAALAQNFEDIALAAQAPQTANASAPAESKCECGSCIPKWHHTDQRYYCATCGDPCSGFGDLAQAPQAEPTSGMDALEAAMLECGISAESQKEFNEAFFIGFRAGVAQTEKKLSEYGDDGVDWPYGKKQDAPRAQPTPASWDQKSQEVAREIQDGEYKDDFVIRVQSRVLGAMKWSAEQALSIAQAAQKAEPTEWRHEIIEPGRTEPWVLLSRSPDNPWSHWLESHLDRCKYKVTPLYDGPIAPPAAPQAEPSAPSGEAVAQQWIPVSEQLPDIGETVLIASVENQVGVGKRQEFNDGTSIFWSNRGYHVKPTHWMPLPPAPSGEEGTEPIPPCTIRSGQRVRTKSKLGDTLGFLIHAKHLDCRAPNITGTVRNYVPGHGCDVWFVEHDDARIGAYMFTELEQIGVATSAPSGEERT